MRLHCWWTEGDCIVGAHQRDTEVETRAAVKAARLRLAGEEPPEAGMPVFRLNGRGQAFDLDPNEVQRQFRWRVYQDWRAMEPVFKAQPKRKAATKRVGVRS